MSQQRHEVRWEQESSLAGILVNADVRHGDEAEVVLDGVGVMSGKASAYLCFCPARVSKVNMIQEATPIERSKPMPATLRFSRRSRRELASKLKGRQGFATLRIRSFVSNGSMHLRDVRVENFQPVPDSASVRRRDDYEDHWLEAIAALGANSR